MTDLRELLDRASDSSALSVPVTDDLARARTALRRRRTWRAGAAAFAVAAVAAGGIGVVAITNSDSDPAAGDRASRHSQPANGATGEAIRLVSAKVTSGSFTLGKLPEGWAVQGENPSAVTIAPTDGSVSPEPLDFAGKLVVTYEQNPIPDDAREVEYNGRTFYFGGSNGYTMIHVPTQDGEPDGKVVVQYPSKNWTEANMLEFAAAVQVNESAEPGLG